MNIIVTPIGIIRNNIDKPIHDIWKDVISKIEIDQKYKQALDGLDDFSHIIVLFWMNQIPPERHNLLKIHPRGRQELPLVGVFATRSQMRPNPIGITIVKLLCRNSNSLEVKGLDAIDGSPVLDIKPFIPELDYHSGTTMPTWAKKIFK